MLRMAISSFLAAGTLGGCALVDGSIDTDVLIVPADLDGRGHGPIVVKPFADKRPEPGRVGVKKNAYGNETADFRATAPVSDWITESLAEGLADVGFQVQQAARDPNTPRVTGTLRQAFVESAVGLWTVEVTGKITIDITVRRADGSMWSRRFTGLSSSGDRLFAPPKTWKQMLHGALEDAVRKAVEGIADLLGPNEASS